MDPVGGVLERHLEAEPVRVPAEPGLVLVGVADPAEALRTEAEDGPVVEQVPVLVAEPGVDDLAVAETPEVAGHGGLQDGLGPGPRHFNFAEGSQVHDDGPFAARPVLVGDVGRVLRGEVVAGVLDERGPESRCAAVERCLAQGHG